MKKEKQNQDSLHDAIVQGHTRTLEDIKRDLEIYWRQNPKYRDAIFKMQGKKVASGSMILPNKPRMLEDIERDLKRYWEIHYPKRKALMLLHNE